LATKKASTHGLVAGAKLRGLPRALRHLPPVASIPWLEILDGITEITALVALDGTILFANKAFLKANRVRGLDVGENLIEYLKDRAANGTVEAPALLRGLAAIIAGQRRHFKHRYAELNLGRPTDAEVRYFTVSTNDERLIVATGSNLTEVTQLKDKGRRLGSALLRAQERERRRIARELHDSTSQRLAAAKADLGQLKQSRDGLAGRRKLVDDCIGTLELVEKEIRTLSYVYHPPALEGRGLVVALKGLADGFARRSGLNIYFRATGDLVDAPIAEMALYRLAQEALVNIYRHAHATDVSISLVIKDKFLHLKIENNAIGTDVREIAEAIAEVVGMAGMRDRIKEIGGRLSFQSNKSTSTFLVSVPKHALPINYVGDPASGIVFSLEDGDAWASWPGSSAPLRLGQQDDVAEMMRDFLAQIELGKRFGG
jgi:signal transduction histidine kinase